MRQVNDEYAVVKDMPVASTREAVGAKPVDNTKACESLLLNSLPQTQVLLLFLGFKEKYLLYLLWVMGKF